MDGSDQNLGMASCPAAEMDEQTQLAVTIMNFMEQGVLVWSANGVCRYFNSRVFQILEITQNDLQIGTERAHFLEMAVGRGEFDDVTRQRTQKLFESGHKFNFDRVVPSGRVVATYARPMREGGYVVTFTDVSDVRKAANELDAARRQADAAKIEAEKVLDAERSRRREAARLASLDEWLQSCRSVDELFEIVVTFMSRFLPGSQGELFIYSNSRDVLDLACTWPGKSAKRYISPDSCWSLRRGRAYVYDPADLCFVCDHVHDNDETPFLCVPIVAHGDTVGMMHVRLMDLEAAGPIRNPVEFAMKCGEHISMAIANVKLRDELHEQSTRDPLTSLFNRRHFLDVMRREIAAARSMNAPLSLIALDADRFKMFNDSHGHDAGDVVLQAIAERMLELGGTSCRLGGEEFAILMPNHGLEEALVQAERLRADVEAVKLTYMGRVLPKVTISVGVASFPDHGNQPHALLRWADAATYAAKEAGRNTTVSANDLKDVTIASGG